MEPQDNKTLLSHIRDGICFDCMASNSCKKEVKCDTSNIKNYDKYKTYISNVLKINNKIIKNCGSQYNKKKYFSICKDINGKCKNCINNRFEIFDYDGKECFYCYIESQDKISIYLHCDIELVGNRCSPKLISLENNYIKEIENNLIEDNNFPLLNNSTVKIHVPLIEYSKILKDPPKKESNNFDQTSPISKSTSNNNITLNITRLNSVESYYDKNAGSTEDNALKTENKSLNEKILKLQKEIKDITDKLMNEKKKLDNKDIYQEMIYNEYEINTSVTEAFMKTNYSDYKIV